MFDGAIDPSLMFAAMTILLQYTYLKVNTALRCASFGALVRAQIILGDSRTVLGAIMHTLSNAWNSYWLLTAMEI